MIVTRKAATTAMPSQSHKRCLLCTVSRNVMLLRCASTSILLQDSGSENGAQPDACRR
jgi:hypothetical protein